MPAYTRSQARKAKTAAAAKPEASFASVPAAAAPLGSPIYLRRKPRTPENTRRVRHALSRAISQSWVLTEAPPTPHILSKSMPKQLKAYETPIHLIGKGLDNPELLRAPKGKKTRPSNVRLPPAIDERPEDGSAYEDVAMQIDDPVGEQFPTEHTWEVAHPFYNPVNFFPDKSVLNQMVAFLGDWFDQNDLKGYADTVEHERRSGGAGSGTETGSDVPDVQNVDRSDQDLATLLGNFFERHPCPKAGASVGEWTAYMESVTLNM